MVSWYVGEFFAHPDPHPHPHPDLDPNPHPHPHLPGYGHMASWYFGEIFAHPRVAGLDFYARLDTDSKITSPIRYDLFAFMRDNGFSYGRAFQHLGCVNGVIGAVYGTLPGMNGRQAVLGRCTGGHFPACTFHATMHTPAAISASALVCDDFHSWVDNI